MCHSIQGNKENDLAIVYTPASNLRKTASMEVGQVRGGSCWGSLLCWQAM